MTGYLAPARVCKHCGAWPCRCGIDIDQGDMPLFALRIERCICRGPAIASGGGTAERRRGGSSPQRDVRARVVANASGRRS